MSLRHELRTLLAGRAPPARQRLGVPARRPSPRGPARADGALRRRLRGRPGRSSAPARAARRSRSGSRGAGGRSSCSSRGRSGIRTRTGCPTRRARTSCTGPRTRVIGGEDPVELGKNNCGHGVGGSMVHYAGYCPRFHPSDFEVRTPRRRRRGLADLLRGARSRTTSGSSSSCRSPATTGRGATRTAIRTRAHPIAGGAEWPRGRRAQARDRDARRSGRDHQRRASATDPTASTAASACRAARSTRRRRRWSPTSPTRSSTAPRSAPTAWRSRSRSTTRAARVTGVRYMQRAVASGSSVPTPSRSPAIRSRRRGCC